MRTELRWVARCWWATILLGAFSLSVRSGGEEHSVRVGMLLVAPYLLVGLHRMAQATRSDTARPALRRTFVVALLLVPAIVLLDWFSSGTLGGGSSVAVVGLLAFSAGLRRWAERRAPELAPMWGRARALALVASLGVVAAWSAWIGRGIAEDRWTSISVSRGQPLRIAAVGVGGLLALAAVLAVARATRATLRYFETGGRSVAR